MRRVLILIALLFVFAIPVKATEISPPEPPEETVELLPAQQSSFGKDLWHVIKSAIEKMQPNLADAGRVCLSLIATVMMVSLLRGFSANIGKILELVSVVAVATILISGSQTMISLGAQTVEKLSNYGKLLLPVMTAGLAAQGGITSSAALYAGTMIFDTVLCTAVTKVLIPMVWAFLGLSVAFHAAKEELLGKIRDFIKWSMTWFLKIILYVFTGYITITGVVSGTADMAALKATKLTLSGMIPVVGGILSDASEAVIVGAGVMKSAVGVSGLLVVLAIWISPFLQIGIQYLLLKATGGLCGVFGIKGASAVIEDFAKAMGFLLAMTGAVCFILLISVVCFMKGMGT